MSELTYEYCCDCGCETGKAGRGEDSIYCDLCDSGPFCEECFDKHRCTQELQKELAAARAEADALKWFTETLIGLTQVRRVLLNQGIIDSRIDLGVELSELMPLIVAAHTKHTARKGEEE